MYTLNEFTSDWRRLHHPSMNVGGDVAFFHQLYCRLHGLVERNARNFNEQDLLSLLLYTENIIAIGLDGVYEYMYRSVGDVVFHWCDGLDMNANATSQVHNLVSQAVADASCSSLRQWMADNVQSCDFQRLSEMLTWFAREDKILRRVFPDLRYRKAMFLSLTGNEQTAKQMLWSDMAFNWQDKHSKSIPATIAEQLRLTTPLVKEQEKAMLKDVADVLETIRAERLDTYTVIERKNERTLTMRHRDGREFRDVIFPTTVPRKTQGQVLVVQLVTYKDKTYVNGLVQWIDSNSTADWNGDEIWADIFNKEQEAAKQAWFTTPFGNRISLYEDLYTLPEAPEEASLAEQGIYLDEPNIFDFFEWLKPSDSVSERNV